MTDARGARPEPPSRARGDGRADAGDAARGARPDDRLHRSADDRRRARRSQPPLLGGHRLPARGDDLDPALRQARRPLRAQGGAPGGPGDLPPRLGAVRDRRRHGRADRLPRDPRNRRRRAHGQRPGGDRRRRLAARARPLHRPLRRRLRGRQRRRAADWRLLHQPRKLALDLLHQHPARARGVGGARDHPSRAPRTPLARDRLPGHRDARRLPLLDRARDHARRHHLRLGLAVHRRPRGARGRLAVRLRLGRAPGGRAGAAAGAVPQPRLPGHQRDRAGGRIRALRRAHLLAPVPADRPRAEPDRVGAAAGPTDARPAHRLDHQRPADRAHRPLQGVPDRRHRGRCDRAGVAGAAATRHRGARGGPLHAGARGRTRPGDAGAGARGPELGPLRAARGGDLVGDPVPLDRRLARDLDPRRDLRQSARHGAG